MLYTWNQGMDQGIRILDRLIEKLYFTIQRFRDDTIIN